MSHWHHVMVDGTKFWISFQRLAFLSINWKTNYCYNNTVKYLFKTIQRNTGPKNTFSGSDEQDLIKSIALIEATKTQKAKLDFLQPPIYT